jgi:hypothetical protein
MPPFLNNSELRKGQCIPDLLTVQHPAASQPGSFVDMYNILKKDRMVVCSHRPFLQGRNTRAILNRSHHKSDMRHFLEKCAQPTPRGTVTCCHRRRLLDTMMAASLSTRTCPSAILSVVQTILYIDKQRRYLKRLGSLQAYQTVESADLLAARLSPLLD